MNKTRIHPLLLSAALTLLTGCFANTTDGCDFRGSLTIRHDRSILPPSMARTLFDLQVYPDRTAVVPLLNSGDTTLTELPRGRYTLLSVNSASATGVGYRNTATANDAELYLPVNSDETRQIKPIPLPLFLSATTADVPANEAVEALMLYKKITKQVNWKLHIVRKGSAAQGEIASCHCALTGVATGYKIATRTLIEKDPAVMILNLSSADHLTYQQSTHLFGFAGGSNELLVEVTLTDGLKRTAGYDLTDKFKNFSGDILNVELELTIDGHRADLRLRAITLTDWLPGTEISDWINSSF